MHCTPDGSLIQYCADQVGSERRGITRSSPVRGVIDGTNIPMPQPPARAQSGGRRTFRRRDDAKSQSLRPKPCRFPTYLIVVKHSHLHRYQNRHPLNRLEYAAAAATCIAEAAHSVVPDRANHRATGKSSRSPHSNRVTHGPSDLRDRYHRQRLLDAVAPDRPRSEREWWRYLLARGCALAR